MTINRKYPQPPEVLTEAARTEWFRVMRAYRNHSFICELDRGLLSAYAQSWGRWVEAETALGTVGDDESAGRILRRTANRYMHNMVDCAAMLGLTPISRARILAAAAGGAAAQPIGIKTERQREAERIAAGPYSPSLPPALRLVDDAG